MHQLYLFNPENDLALAHGKSQYTAPPNALRLHVAGASLPLWFCHEGDFIYAPNVKDSWFKQITSQFDIKGEIAHEYNISKIRSCVPWGWSLNAKRQFQCCGVDSSILPDDKYLNKIRDLSHRRISIEVLQRIKEIFPSLNVAMPCEAKTEHDVFDYIQKHGGIYLKSPWSSSGRGVVNASLLSEEELTRRALGIIRRQGSVMCEKALDKVRDFAMLFYSDGSGVKYQGVSMFFNEPNGAYAGNILTSQEKMIKDLNKYPTRVSIDELSHGMEIVLSNILSHHYIGYLGVDMMIYKEDENHYEIMPCIEVNLRMTMGVVAMLWSENHMAKDSHGVMRVEYKTNSFDEVPNAQVLEFEGKKLKSGTISLIPPDEYFNIYVSLKNDVPRNF